jgi:hypothetical protein
MDAQQQTDLKAYAERLEHLCRAQADEIRELRDELARATEGAGALATLQALYRDPDLPQSLRAKCAIGCLVHETPALKPVQPPLELIAEPVIPLAELVAQRRARAARLELELTDSIKAQLLGGSREPPIDVLPEDSSSD